MNMEEGATQTDSTLPVLWWQRHRKQRKDIDFDALAQFVESLRAELVIATDIRSTEGAELQTIADIISIKLDEAENKRLPLEGRWNKAYHAERLMLLLFSPERRKIELLKRLNECQRVQAHFTSFYETQIASDEDDTGDSRDFHLLASLIGDLQRYNSNKHLKMRYARYAVYKVGLMFCVSLLMFMSVISLFHWD